MEENREQKLEELIKKARDGDRKVFTEIFILIRNDLYKLAKAKVKKEEDIEDIVQETMIQAYISIRRLKSPQAFKKWITKIIMNKCKQYFKRKEKRELNVDTEIFDYIEKEKKERNPLESTENAIDFHLLLQNLEEKEKIIILLFYNQKYTTKEISDVLGINENTVKTKLTRAKRKIKKEKEEEDNYGRIGQIH